MTITLLQWTCLTNGKAFVHVGVFTLHNTRRAARLFMHFSVAVFILVIFGMSLSTFSLAKVDDLEDILANPYGTKPHGAQKTLDELRKQMVDLHAASNMTYFDNTTYEVYNVSRHNDHEDAARYVKRGIGIDINGQLSNGRLYQLENPLGHFSILEPSQGCRGGTTPVRESAEQKQCVVATNAGFFNTSTGGCFGNVVSDGNVVQTPGSHNVNFGITKNGAFIVGYIDASQAGDFDQLVAGVIWLVRNRRPYVNISETLEDMTAQASGPTFVTIRTSRVALGHDANGQILIVVMDGASAFQKGPNLHEMAQLMLDLGAVNAINLDGGGSSTVIESGALVNYVTDRCTTPGFVNSVSRCERRVTTITCIHNRLLPTDAETDWKRLALTFGILGLVMTALSVVLIITLLVLVRKYRSLCASI